MRRASGWMLVVLQFALLALLVLVPRSDSTPLRVLLGTVPLVASITLGLWAGVRLGTALTPTPVPIPGANLRTDGPYSHLRHPMYTAVLLAALAFTIATGSLWTVLVLLALALFFAAKARWEDAMLKQAHGADWVLWAGQTGSLTPRWHSRDR